MDAKKIHLIILCTLAAIAVIGIGLLAEHSTRRVDIITQEMR